MTRLQHRDQLVAMLQAVGEGAEARIVGEARQVHAMRQALPELLLHAHDDQVAVLGGEGLRRHQRLMRAVRQPFEAVASIEIPHRQVVEHGDGGVEQS